MNGLNAIIKDGKVYEVKLSTSGNPCEECDVKRDCAFVNCRSFDRAYTDCYLKYSQSLTDKLNKQ